MPITPDDLETCLRVLQDVADDPALINDHPRFKTLVAKIHRRGKKERRRVAHKLCVAADRQKIARTGIVQRELLRALPSARDVGVRLDARVAGKREHVGR